METKKLKAFGIIKEALIVFTKNTNFTILTILVSLPLFCFSLYFETSLQNFLLQTTALLQGKDETPEVVNQLVELTSEFALDYYYYYSGDASHGTNWSLLDIVRKFDNDLYRHLGQLVFLYLVPLHLLELVTVLVIVDLAAKIYRQGKSLGFSDLFDIKLDGARLRGVLVTYVYVVFFSTCTLLGFVVLLVTYTDVLRYFPVRRSKLFYVSAFRSLDFDVFFHLVYGTNLLLFLGFHLGWSAIWNLGLVMSVLKAGISGAKALGSSAFLSLRNVQNGMILMLVFSIWGVWLRLPCLVFGCHKKWVWIVAQSSLICLGNALKWVSVVVYFDDCIKRIFGKKVDVEGG